MNQTRHPLQLLPPLEQIWNFTSDFRMSDDALFKLAKYFCQHTPKYVLEFGPGLSTYVVLKYFEVAEMPVSLVSYNEPGPYWDTFTREWLKSQFPQFNIDKIVHTVPMAGDEWYSKVEYVGVPDLIIIDGPCSSIARNCDRAKTFLMGLADPEFTTVLIDDTHRTEELKLFQSMRGLGYSNFSKVRDTLIPHRTTHFLYGPKIGPPAPR